MTTTTTIETVIQSGAFVTVRDDHEGAEDERYQIVDPSNSNAHRGRVSDTSPMGFALLGHQPGDRVRFKAPGGTRTVHVMAVRPADQ